MIQDTASYKSARTTGSTVATCDVKTLSFDFLLSSLPSKLILQQLRRGESKDQRMVDSGDRSA